MFVTISLVETSNSKNSKVKIGQKYWSVKYPLWSRDKTKIQCNRFVLQGFITGQNLESKALSNLEISRGVKNDPPWD